MSKNYIKLIIIQIITGIAVSIFLGLYSYGISYIEEENQKKYLKDFIIDFHGTILDYENLNENLNMNNNIKLSKYQLIDSIFEKEINELEKITKERSTKFTYDEVKDIEETYSEYKTIKSLNKNRPIENFSFYLKVFKNLENIEWLDLDLKKLEGN